MIVDNTKFNIERIFYLKMIFYDSVGINAAPHMVIVKVNDSVLGKLF